MTLVAVGLWLRFSPPSPRVSPAVALLVGVLPKAVSKRFGRILWRTRFPVRDCRCPLI
jgi:hypothetical protein